MALLEVSGTGRQIAGTFRLHDIFFSQERQQKTGIAGATGSGKSTLLKIIAGLEEPDAGVILFEGEKVKGPAYRLIPGQPGIAYLSQHYELRNHYRMEELLSYANTLPGKEAQSLFEICRISHLLQRRTDQLSGGEKQRIALARLLLTQPRLLLLDEPYSNLDMIHTAILKEVIEDLRREKGLSCIIASHDPSDLLPWADELLILQNGRIVQQGKPEAVYHKPRTAYAGALLGKYNLLDPQAAQQLGQDIPADKQLFLRPEQLKLSTRSKGVKAVVQQLSFWGSHYEAVLSLPGQLMMMKTGNGRLKEGQEVYITLEGPLHVLHKEL